MVFYDFLQKTYKNNSFFNDLGGTFKNVFLIVFRSAEAAGLGGRTSFLVLLPWVSDAMNHKGSADLSPLGVRAAALARGARFTRKFNCLENFPLKTSPRRFRGKRSPDVKTSRKFNFLGNCTLQPLSDKSSKNL